MVYVHIKKQYYDLTRDHVIVKYVRKNRAPAGYSDRFSRTYATIAGLLIVPMSWFLVANIAQNAKNPTRACSRTVSLKCFVGCCISCY
jgi:hypothetical protein